MNKMKVLFIATLFVLIGIEFFEKAQAADNLKIGYVDVISVFNAYDKTKDKDDMLGAKSENKQKERAKMVDSIKNMKNELELLNDAQSQKKQTEIDGKIGKLQDFERETKVALQKERDDMVREISKEINAAIEDYAKKNGFTLMLNSRVLVYADEQYDITREILNTLNSKYRKSK